MTTRSSILHTLTFWARSFSCCSVSRLRMAAMEEVPVLVLAGIVVGVGTPTIPLRPLVGVFPWAESSSPEFDVSWWSPLEDTLDRDDAVLVDPEEAVRVDFLPLRARPIVRGIIEEALAFLDFLDPFSLPLLELEAKSE